MTRSEYYARLERDRHEYYARGAHERRRYKAARLSSLALDRAPSFLGTIISLVIACFVLVGSLGLAIDGNDMTDYFAGDLSDIHCVSGADDTPFYYFGASEQSISIHGHETSWICGKHVDVQDAVNWFNATYTVAAGVSEDPLTRGVIVIWSIVQNELHGIFVNVAETVIPDPLQNYWKTWTTIWSAFINSVLPVSEEVNA